MGEVYRARDTTLNRDVALKVLPAAAALDPDRLQRFIREAQSLAALNHPHIAQIYGFENNVLVMELVEGEDLSERIARGALPLDEAMPIARQIAEALEAAHEVGIIHRDLKPANVKVRGDGTVKVLDFGLAKAFDPGSGSGSGRTGLANSPTTTSPAAVTAAGMILGTAAYMSPEQARGKAVDKRADIWAFGAVVYEMLSGRFAFPGDTVTDVIAAVVSREPDWSALPAAVPASLQHLLRRCLEKDHRLRLRDIGEARVALGSTGTAVAPAVGIPSSAPVPESRPPKFLRWTLAVLAMLGVVTAFGVFGVIAMSFLEPVPPGPLRRLELSMPANVRNFELSPDGRKIAYFTGGRVWAIDLERLESRDLAPAPLGQRNLVFWSPDSAFVGYNSADGKLWTVPAGGGAPLLLCTIPESRQLMGAAWRADGSIILAVWRGNLYLVPQSGGEPKTLVTIDPAKEIDFHLPVPLPDGRLMLTTHLTPALESAIDTFQLEILDGAHREAIFGTGLFPLAYVEPGYLLALRFDAGRGIWAFPYSGRGQLRTERGVLIAAGGDLPSVAGADTLLHALPATTMPSREVVWVDRTGRVIAQVRPAGDVAAPALSPDGQRVAFSARVNDNQDIWVRDLEQGTESRVTFEPTEKGRPTWFPSGRRLAYLETGGGINTPRLVARGIDGGSDRLELAAGMSPSISPDGRHLIFHVDERGSDHVRYSTFGADGKISSPAPVFRSSPEPNVNGSTLSPDGKFLAYVERQASGNSEVCVTRFPSGEGRWQISTNGGRAPVWAANGELFFLSGSTDGPKQMMAVPMKRGDTLGAGTPVTLFEVPDELDADYQLPMFDVAGDGKRLLMLRRAAGAAPSVRWVLVQNWRTQLRVRR